MVTLRQFSSFLISQRSHWLDLCALWFLTWSSFIWPVAPWAGKFLPGSVLSLLLANWLIWYLSDQNEAKEIRFWIMLTESKLERLEAQALLDFFLITVVMLWTPLSLDWLYSQLCKLAITDLLHWLTWCQCPPFSLLRGKSKRIFFFW